MHFWENDISIEYGLEFVYGGPSYLIKLVGRNLGNSIRTSVAHLWIEWTIKVKSLLD